MFTKENLPKTELMSDIINPTYWIVVMGFILIGGIFATLIVGNWKTKNESLKLQNKVETIAATIDGSNILNLSGTKSDLNKKTYTELKERMIAIRSVTTGARFVYLMGLRNGKLFFFVDSEPADSPDYSAPGDVYEETLPQEVFNFINKKSFVEGPYTDKWGSWVSGYAPIPNPNTGEPMAIVGIDISSREWDQEILYSQMLPISITLCLVLLLYLYYESQKRKANIIMRRLEFVSIASHQLRTPLTSIKWFSEILLDNKAGELNEKQRDYINEISHGNERMIKLVNDILSASNIETNDFKITKKPVDIVKIIDFLKSDLIGLSKEHDVELVTDTEFPKELILMIDGDKMKQVLMNLFSNAIKYSRRGGKVKISHEDTGSHVIIKVTDEGVGIPESVKNKVFQKFFRADNAIQTAPNGSGLGLYIARHIAELHGGKLYFTSRENVGTTFFLELPVEPIE